MGRTVAPFTYILNKEKKNLSNFRRALKKEDQEIFDELWERARKHIQACSFSSFPLPMEGILLAMCMEMLKEIKNIKDSAK
jgi:hypothetical protein